MDPTKFVRDEEEDENNHPIRASPASSRLSDGFESQLQIQIGPHGGSISASRRRNSGNNPQSNNNVPIGVIQPINSRSIHHPMNADLLGMQKERKQKLVMALNADINRLVQLRTEISSLRSKIQQIPDMDRLKANNQKLRIECDLMARQVDLYDNGTVPLGETSEEFYREINPGQDLPNQNLSTKSNRRLPPARPPPPKILELPTQRQTGEWTCSLCTFLNSEFLQNCEQCNMTNVHKNVQIQNPQVSPSGSEPRSYLQYRD